MTRLENIEGILRKLLADCNQQFDIPSSLAERQRMMRALMNIRQPVPATREFLQAQDRELQMQAKDRGTVEIGGKGMLLWQGDITRLKVDAIVNAANSQMLGCWRPLHHCIDNCIHSAAGIQLRQECYEQMRAQGHEEPTGTARITKGYNLPAKHVIHTVGPIIPLGKLPSRRHEMELASCYQSCLDTAEANGLQSIAFCCISTGVFNFPNEQAAEIAITCVRNYLASHPGTSLQQIIFNVFLDKDHDIYKRLLNAD